MTGRESRKRKIRGKERGQEKEKKTSRGIKKE
jgi:hypothetical protein